MSKIEIEKEIDGLGRVVIPKDFRKIANIKLKSKVLLSLSSGGVFITPFKKSALYVATSLWRMPSADFVKAAF